jgi:hypothetical protein
MRAALQKGTEPSRGKDSARRLRTLILLLRYSGMRIGDVVRPTLDKIKGNKLFPYTQKSDVAVYTVLPDFVISSIEAAPVVAGAHLFWNGLDDLDAVKWKLVETPSQTFWIAKIVDGHAHRFRDTCAAELLWAGVPRDLSAKPRPI